MLSTRLLPYARSAVMNNAGLTSIRSMAAYQPPANYKPPTMDELPIPCGSWQEDYNSKQRKYTLHLAVGATIFATSFFIFVQSKVFPFNLGPTYKNE